ncbi:MAG TPA: hypothetical protein VHA52_09390, partial [Candidatus Babeliaceae bacterium]|nr:hypothetical protein [Candidatus Babeliaceae bacterium]
HTMKMIHQRYAPPEYPMSIWGSMGVTQFAFQINPQTTVFIDPVVLGEFFQTATSEQKRAVQKKLVQLARRSFQYEKSMSIIQRVKTLGSVPKRLELILNRA